MNPIHSAQSPTHYDIPMSSPDIGAEERAAVLAVLNTPGLSMGPEILAFEDALSTYTGSPYAVGVSSGTAGLHLCVRAAGIGVNEDSPDDLVITTPFSFVSSANVLLFEGALPVFVDVDPLTGNIDPALVVQAVTDLIEGGSSARRWLPRQGVSEGSCLKAILPVDVFGQPADLKPVLDIAEKYDLKVIEDACEALGSTYYGRQAGTLGNYGVFAFYPNKQITTGEGGMIVTRDDQAAQYMRSLRNQGRAPGDTWLQHTYLGYNYRMDELSAALGRVQMRRLDEFIAQRQKVAGWYIERLDEIPGVEPPFIAETTTKISWFVFVVRFLPGIEREAVADGLKARGIPARPYFIPIHTQPYMAARFGYRAGDFPVTEDLGRRSLALPFSSVMKEDQVGLVCTVLRDIIKK